MAFRLYRKRSPPLGDLERDVLEVLWSRGADTAQAVHGALCLQRDITLSTVQSTVERLVRKGLLRREKLGRAYFYAPALSRAMLLARMVAELVNDLSDNAMQAGSGIVDLSQDVDDDTLDALQNWVEDTRRGRDNSDGAAG